MISCAFNQCPPLDGADREKSLSSIEEYQKLDGFSIKKSGQNGHFFRTFISILAVLWLVDLFEVALSVIECVNALVSKTCGVLFCLDCSGKDKNSGI